MNPRIAQLWSYVKLITFKIRKKRISSKIELNFVFAEQNWYSLISIRKIVISFWHKNNILNNREIILHFWDCDRNPKKTRKESNLNGFFRTKNFNGKPQTKSCFIAGNSS